jgi:hypothetical protein
MSCSVDLLYPFNLTQPLIHLNNTNILKVISISLRYKFHFYDNMYCIAYKQWRIYNYFYFCYFISKKIRTTSKIKNKRNCLKSQENPKPNFTSKNIQILQF